MDYSFNAHIAEQYGVEEAVFIHNLYWWISKNKANGQHFYEGRTWTYNSAKAFADLFPFWTPKQIRRIIKKLEAEGALHIGNFNEKGFDRTQWYALDESVTRWYEMGKCMCPNGQMDVAKRENGSAQTGTPIPDSKPNSKPDSKQYPPLTPHPEKLEDISGTEEVIDSLPPKIGQAVTNWVQYKKEKRQKYTPTGLSALINKIKRAVDECGEQAVIDLINLCMANGWQGIVWDKLKKPDKKPENTNNIFLQMLAEEREAKLNGS